MDQVDPRADNTETLQGMIDEAGEGGTATIPPGIWTVNPGVGLILRSNMTLQMSGATLTITSNVAPYSCALAVPPGIRDVRICGGEVVGSQANVTGLQWSIGLRIDSASNVTVEGTSFEGWWTDGVWIGGNTPACDIVLSSITATGNRRNGTSITNASRVSITDSLFELCKGQDPQSGVDVESNPGERVTEFAVRNSVFRSNSGVGLYMHQGQGEPGENFKVISCSFSDNAKYGVILTEAHGALVTDNVIDSSPIGMSVGGGASQITIAGNTFSSPRTLILAGVVDPRVIDNRLAQLETPSPGISGDVIIVDNN